MRDKIKFNLVMLFALTFISCNVNQPAAREIDAFVRDIDRSLRNISTEEQVIKVGIPNGIEGFIVMSAPYAISSENELGDISSDSLNKELINIVQDDSAYHLLIIKNKQIVIHQKWTSPPVVFNGLFSCRLISNKQLEFKVRNKVLLNIRTTE